MATKEVYRNSSAAAAQELYCFVLERNPFPRLISDTFWKHLPIRAREVILSIRLLARENDFHVVGMKAEMRRVPERDFPDYFYSVPDMPDSVRAKVFEIARDYKIQIDTIFSSARDFLDPEQQIVYGGIARKIQFCRDNDDHVEIASCPYYGFVISEPDAKISEFERARRNKQLQKSECGLASK